jgi:hypothetical protein
MEQEQSYREYSWKAGFGNRAASQNRTAPHESPRLSRYDTASQPMGGDAFRGAPMTELLVALALIAGVVVAHEIGFWLGSLTRSDDEPFDRQVALIRTSHGRSSCIFNRLCIFRGSIALHRSAGYRREGGERTRYRILESRYRS